MIDFISHKDFAFSKSSNYSKWLVDLILEEQFEPGELTIIFHNDNELLAMNLKYLNHDTLTDIITFDYSQGRILSGDICISFERVRENAYIYGVTFQSELARVMAHGILHLCGYNDKTKSETHVMRSKENYYVSKLQLDI